MKKDEKRSKRISDLLSTVIISLFISVLLVGGALSLILKSGDVSEKEQRALKKYPVFSWSSFFNGSFFKEAEEAYNDRFPLRDFYIDTAAGIREFMTVKTGREFIPIDNEDEDYFNPVGIGTPAPETNLAPSATPEPAENNPRPTGDVASSTPEQTPDEQGTASPGETAGLSETPADATPTPTPTPSPTLTPTPTPSPSPTPTAAPSSPAPFDISGYEVFTGGRTLSGVVIEGGRGMEVFNGTSEAAEGYTLFMKRLAMKYPGKNVVSTVTPNACAFYASSEYTTENHDQKAWLELAAKNMQGVIVPDLYNALAAHKDEYIFFKTDHHWTALGAYYSYKEICRNLGMTPVDINALEVRKIEGFLGSIYKKTNSKTLEASPDTIFCYMPKVRTNALCCWSRSTLNLKELNPIDVVNPYYGGSNLYVCFIAGDNPYTEITTSAGTGRTCLIIKNSYANCLVPWLCHNYDKLYILDPRHVNTTGDNQFSLGGFLEGHDVDDIIVVSHTLFAATTDNVFYAGLMRLSF